MPLLLSQSRPTVRISRLRSEAEQIGCTRRCVTRQLSVQLSAMIHRKEGNRQFSALRRTSDRVALRYAPGQHVAECKGEKGRGAKPDEATLSQPLRALPLPVTRVPVGYCWQNSR